jgi:hypothetical protein
VKHIRSVNSKAKRIEAYVAGVNAAAAGEAAVQPDAASPAAGAPDVVAGDDAGSADGHDIVALQQPPAGPHIPLGCTFLFSPGWETDSRGGTAGLCQPVERDLFDCHLGCFWPAHVPDQLNHAPDWTGTCAAAQKDWRKIDLIFP